VAVGRKRCRKFEHGNVSGWEWRKKRDERRALRYAEHNELGYLTKKSYVERFDQMPTHVNYIQACAALIFNAP
jgi:hypothetical protein